MSFSSDIKQELNKSSDLANKTKVKYELVGYLLSGNIELQNNNKIIKFTTESDYNINRFSKLLTNLNKNHKIEVAGKNFIVKLKIKEIEDLIETVINITNVNKEKTSEITINEELKNDILAQEAKQGKEENKKAIIRGSFMGSGSINNPENTYHLEIVFHSENNRNFIKKLLEDFGVNVKIIDIKNKKSIYLKEGEEISKILALIGANKAVMQFEEIRIKREMRGKVNRLVNCETANLNKTINASIEQISAIKKLQETGRFSKLDENLKEIAILRLENPEMSLVDLGKMLKKPVGKSGVNYRLKKIMEIANE